MHSHCSSLLKKPFKVFATILTSSLLLIFCSGCVVLAAGAAGAAGVAYLKGGLQANLDASLKNSISATKDAGKTLELNRISETSDAISGEVLFRDSKDRKVTVTLTKITRKITSIEIRVGTFGDENVSRMFFGSKPPIGIGFL